MSSLFRRSNGINYLVSSHNGRRIWVSTECRRRKEALKFALSGGRKPKKARDSAATSSLKLSQFTPQVLASIRSNLAPGTVALYRSALTVFCEKTGDLPLPEYTPQMVEQFKSARLAEVSPVKVNIDFRTLRAAFNIGVSWGLLTENPFRRCRQIKVAAERPVYLSGEDFGRLLSAIPDEWFKDLVRFAVATMMRLGEIVNLRWESLDLNRRVIMVENRGGFRTKTNRSRAIPMDELIHLMLTRKERMGDRVFTLPSGRPLRVGYVSGTFKKYVRKAGIDDRIHFHSLRHTGATWMVQRDVPIYSVQQILGHSRVDMTQVYSHLDVEHLRRPIAAIGEVLSETLCAESK